jgi:hypothetical protein
MLTFMAGATNTGAFVASAVARSALSQIPQASFARVFAEAGAITIASAQSASSIWPIPSAVSSSHTLVRTGLPERAWKVSDEMNFEAADVITTRTSNLRFTNNRINSAALYAAIDPDTPTTTLRTLLFMMPVRLP